jgi:glycosyltransferase involved in cell wall biosynthesis
MLGKYENIDRKVTEPSLEPVDVLMLTLDAETYLGKCLDSLYKEVPVNNLIVVDGGSKDNTIEILNKYPRVKINIRPDIKTTGKCFEVLFNQVSTPWIVFIDADMELGEGWYDEMLTHKGKYDFFESKRINHFEFYRESSGSINMDERSYAVGQFARIDCFRNYHVDDDYMWGATDLMLKQVAEKNGYKYGKVATAYHYHHTTENWRFESDLQKRGRRLVFQGPSWEIIDDENWEKAWDNYKKAIVKYIDPESIYPKEREGTLWYLRQLDLDWVKQTNTEWYNILLADKKYSTIRRLRKIFTRLFTLPIILIKRSKRAIEYILEP